MTVAMDGRTVINRLGRYGEVEVKATIDGAGARRIETDGHFAVNEVGSSGLMRLHGVCPSPKGFGMTRTVGRDWRCGCGRWRDVHAGRTEEGHLLRMFVSL